MAISPLLCLAEDPELKQQSPAGAQRTQLHGTGWEHRNVLDMQRDLCRKLPAMFKQETSKRVYSPLA